MVRICLSTAGTCSSVEQGLKSTCILAISPAIGWNLSSMARAVIVNPLDTYSAFTALIALIRVSIFLLVIISAVQKCSFLDTVIKKGTPLINMMSASRISWPYCLRIGYGTLRCSNLTCGSLSLTCFPLMLPTSFPKMSSVERTSYNVIGQFFNRLSLTMDS